MSGEQNEQDIRIYVGNLGYNVQLADVVEFLNLNKSASVELKNSKNIKFCFATVKCECVPDILRKNGEELYGRNIVVQLANNQHADQDMEVDPSTPTQQSADTTVPPPAPSKSSSQAPAIATTATSGAETGGEVGEITVQTKVFSLQFATIAKPFRLPSHAEVAVTLHQHFAQHGMKCIPIYGRAGDMSYKVELREEVAKDGHFLQFGDLKVPLYAWEKPSKPTRRQGVLLTFKGADQGELSDIPAGEFDKAMAELKFELIVPTKLQFWKSTSVLNGNRMCVIETPSNLRTIPDSIPVTNTNTKRTYQVKIDFKGQERYCSRCNEMHVTRCPEAEKRRAMYEEREKLKGETKVKLYSDSTLRSADVLGITADILCMSGGGLGQVVQAVIDDPDQGDNVVIFGGTNDQKLANFPVTEDYAHNVDMSLTKLGRFARENEEKTFHIIHQQHSNQPDTVHADAVIRKTYLLTRMTKLAEVNKNIVAETIKYEVDETGHPTLEGTKQILRRLHEIKISKTPLIWNDECLVTDRPYSKVQSVYRYGCGGCQKFGAALQTSAFSNQLFCDECYNQPVSERRDPLLRKIAQRVEEAAQAAAKDNFPEPKRAKTEGLQVTQ